MNFLNVFTEYISNKEKESMFTTKSIDVEAMI